MPPPPAELAVFAGDLSLLSSTHIKEIHTYLLLLLQEILLAVAGIRTRVCTHAHVCVHVHTCTLVITFYKKNDFQEEHILHCIKH